MAGASLLNVVLGVWSTLVPWVLQLGPGIASSAHVLTGLMVIVIAGLSIAAARWHVLAWLNVLCGLSILVSPWVFGYASRPGPMWNDVIVGSFIVLLALGRAVVPAAVTPEI